MDRIRKFQILNTQIFTTLNNYQQAGSTVPVEQIRCFAPPIHPSAATSVWKHNSMNTQIFTTLDSYQQPCSNVATSGVTLLLHSPIHHSAVTNMFKLSLVSSCSPYQIWGWLMLAAADMAASWPCTLHQHHGLADHHRGFVTTACLCQTAVHVLLVSPFTGSDV